MRYGAREVLGGVDFTVLREELICLLGPNGAGKTTTIEIFEGLRILGDPLAELLVERRLAAGLEAREATVRVGSAPAIDQVSVTMTRGRGAVYRVRPAGSR